MSIMELGALGEFLGSIGVIATLVYLAIQIRQNTHSLDEGRRLAMAQAYQARATQVEESLRETTHSHYWPSIQVKINESGVEALSPEEHIRYRAWQGSIRDSGSSGRDSGPFFDHVEQLIAEADQRRES